MNKCLRAQLIFLGASLAVLPISAVAQSTSLEFDGPQASEYASVSATSASAVEMSFLGEEALDSIDNAGLPTEFSVTPSTEAAGANSSDLTVIISPYVWIPTVSGDIDVGARGLQFDLDAGDLLNVFEFGGLIRGEVRHESGWGVAVDYIFADLGADVSIVIGNVEADIDASILEATVVRRVQSGPNPIDIYAGLRRWDANVTADITIPFLSTTVEVGDEWIDPIVGARYQHSLSPRWRILGQLDVGGFGVGSDFTWNAALGASYNAWENASFQLVYKVLSIDRQSPSLGTGPNVDLSITIQGPLIGFAYRF